MGVRWYSFVLLAWCLELTALFVYGQLSLGYEYAQLVYRITMHLWNRKGLYVPVVSC